jgi:hypothetical protein
MQWSSWGKLMRDSLTRRCGAASGAAAPAAAQTLNSDRPAM